MKNRGAAVLILLTLAAVVFTGGFFLGRSANRSPIQLQDLPAATSAKTSAPPVSQRIDLNTATEDQLQTLPGIGPVLARRILAYREAQGGFTAPEELKNIEGIGEKRYQALADYITIGG